MMKILGFILKGIESILNLSYRYWRYTSVSSSKELKGRHSPLGVGGR